MGDRVARNTVSDAVRAQLEQEIEQNKQPERVQQAAARKAKYEAGLLAQGAAAAIARRLAATAVSDDGDAPADAHADAAPSAEAAAPATPTKSAPPPPVVPRPAGLTAATAAVPAAPVLPPLPPPPADARTPATLWLLSRHDITLLKELGRGAAAMAFLARFADATVVATELVGPMHEAARQTVEAEAEWMKRVCSPPHAHLLHYYGTVVDDRGALIVTEPYDLGRLPAYLTAHPTLAPAMRLTLCVQVARGLAHLHAHAPPVVHHDVRAHNIVLASDRSGALLAKVAGFGLWRTLPSEETAWETRPLDGADPVSPAHPPVHAPVRWAAPEVLATKTAYPSSDVWSFAVTAWEIYTNGALPYAGTSGDADVMDGVINRTLVLTEPDRCPKPVWAALQRCLVYTAHERPHFTEVADQLAAL
jgi:hypothetical protein